MRSLGSRIILTTPTTATTAALALALFLALAPALAAVAIMRGKHGSDGSSSLANRRVEAKIVEDIGRAQNISRATKQGGINIIS